MSKLLFDKVAQSHIGNCDRARIQTQDYWLHSLTSEIPPFHLLKSWFSVVSAYIITLHKALPISSKIMHHTPIKYLLSYH